MREAVTVSAQNPRDGDRDGAVVVVTGSTSGIGLALAAAAIGRGMRVVLNGRAPERVAAAEQRLAAPDGTMIGVAADLRDADQAHQLAQAAVERFGRVDLWVNNAAGLFFARAEDITPNGWRTIVDTNLNAAFHACRAVFPIMRAQGAGSILNISSVAADRPHPGAAHYAASKAALNSLTQTLAVEWARYGIQVNGVALGPVLTEASRFNDAVLRTEAEQEQPTGRIATAEEAAAVILDLAAVRSPYFTGETVRVDGGFRSVLRNPMPDERGS